jgi:hypothetical protein
MRLTSKQTRQLLHTHGVYVNEVCDRCDAVLGPIRFTRQGHTGAWCSRACRDGVDLIPGVCHGCGTSLVGKRRGTMYCHRTCRMRTVRKQVRNSANIVNTHIQKTGVADTISGVGYGDSRTGPDTV